MEKMTKSLPLGILGLVLFAYIGSKFHDIDQRTDVLTHRSILTHGLIVPVVFFLAFIQAKKQPDTLFCYRFPHWRSYSFVS